MKAYKFRIEAGFIRLPGEEWAGNHGFVCTVYAQAGSPREALERAARKLKKRMRAHRVVECEGLVCRTTCVVRDFWEVDAPTYAEYADKDTGFTFFRIGSVSAVDLWLRLSLTRAFKRHLVIDLPAIGDEAGEGTSEH